jgi:2-keto-3-deoxy-galactonokinase
MPRLQMRSVLRDWLDSLSTSDRAVIVAMAGHTEDAGPLFAGLLRSAAAEIIADRAFEARAIEQLEADRRADVERLAAGAVFGWEPDRDDNGYVTSP